VSSLTASLGAGVCKGLADHFDKGTFVNTDIFAATALYLLTPGCKGKFFGDSCLVTA
jgi:hypothetical protein